MATTEQIKLFISTIAVLARNEYLSREKWILPSVCIAQAALESGWDLKARSVFGIKGEGFVATTTEYYNGVKATIQDSFRQYPDIAASVVGYYDFLRDTPRYARALNNQDYKDTVDKLIHTTDGAPYATAPNYAEVIVAIIEQNDLTQYDVRDVLEIDKNEPISAQKTVLEMAAAVIRGEYDVYPRRKELIEADGGNYDEVQDKVEELMGVAGPVKPIETAYRTTVVLDGEGFWSVAERVLGDGRRMQEVWELNGMTKDTVIHPGDVLKVPN